MIPEITSLLTASKAAYDIAKGISSLKTDVERNERLSETLDVLISIKTNALSVLSICEKLQKEKDDLTQKIIELENWSKTEAKYELTPIAAEVFVYSYKQTNEEKKPMHWLCSKCFHERKAHIIQLQSQSAAGKHYLCPNCNTKYEIHLDLPPVSSNNKLARSYVPKLKGFK